MKGSIKLLVMVFLASFLQGCITFGEALAAGVAMGATVDSMDRSPEHIYTRQTVNACVPLPPKMGGCE